MSIGRLAEFALVYHSSHTIELTMWLLSCGVHMKVPTSAPDRLMSRRQDTFAAEDKT
jgi:hypothetical protein